MKSQNCDIRKKRNYQFVITLAVLSASVTAGRLTPPKLAAKHKNEDVLFSV
jgi:hypothetical protein